MEQRVNKSKQSFDNTQIHHPENSNNGLSRVKEDLSRMLDQIIIVEEEEDEESPSNHMDGGSGNAASSHNSNFRHRDTNGITNNKGGQIRYKVIDSPEVQHVVGEGNQTSHQQQHDNRASPSTSISPANSSPSPSNYMEYSSGNNNNTATNSNNSSWTDNGAFGSNKLSSSPSRSNSPPIARPTIGKNASTGRVSSAERSPINQLTQQIRRTIDERLLKHHQQNRGEEMCYPHNSSNFLRPAEGNDPHYLVQGDGHRQHRESSDSEGNFYHSYSAQPSPAMRQAPTYYNLRHGQMPDAHHSMQHYPVPGGRDHDAESSLSIASCSSAQFFEPQWRDRCNTWPLQQRPTTTTMVAGVSGNNEICESRSSNVGSNQPYEARSNNSEGGSNTHLHFSGSDYSATTHPPSVNHPRYENGTGMGTLLSQTTIKEEEDDNFDCSYGFNPNVERANAYAAVGNQSNNVTCEPSIHSDNSNNYNNIHGPTLLSQLDQYENAANIIGDGAVGHFSNGNGSSYLNNTSMQQPLPLLSPEDILREEELLASAAAPYQPPRTDSICQEMKPAPPFPFNPLGENVTLDSLLAKNDFGTSRYTLPTHYDNNSADHKRLLFKQQQIKEEQYCNPNQTVISATHQSSSDIVNGNARYKHYSPGHFDLALKFKFSSTSPPQNPSPPLRTDGVTGKLTLLPEDQSSIAISQPLNKEQEEEEKSDGLASTLNLENLDENSDLSFPPSTSASSRRNAWGNFSYADLITKAILTAPERRLTLAQIYDWMVQYIPYFKDKGDNNSSAGWKNSIRHNLSLHNRFIRVQNEGAGKSSWWMINPEAQTTKTVRRRAATLDNTSVGARNGAAAIKRGRIRRRTNTNSAAKQASSQNSAHPKYHTVPTIIDATLANQFHASQHHGSDLSDRANHEKQAHSVVIGTHGASKFQSFNYARDHHSHIMNQSPYILPPPPPPSCQSTSVANASQNFLQLLNQTMPGEVAFMGSGAMDSTTNLLEAPDMLTANLSFNRQHPYPGRCSLPYPNNAGGLGNGDQHDGPQGAYDRLASYRSASLSHHGSRHSFLKQLTAEHPESVHHLQYPTPHFAPLSSQPNHASDPQAMKMEFEEQRGEQLCTNSYTPNNSRILDYNAAHTNNHIDFSHPNVISYHQNSINGDNPAHLWPLNGDQSNFTDDPYSQSVIFRDRSISCAASFSTGNKRKFDEERQQQLNNDEIIEISTQGSNNTISYKLLDVSSKDHLGGNKNNSNINMGYGRMLHWDQQDMPHRNDSNTNLAINSTNIAADSTLSSNNVTSSSPPPPYTSHANFPSDRDNIITQNTRHDVHSSEVDRRQLRPKGLIGQVEHKNGTPSPSKFSLLRQTLNKPIGEHPNFSDFMSPYQYRNNSTENPINMEGVDESNHNYNDSNNNISMLPHHLQNSYENVSYTHGPPPSRSYRGNGSNAVGSSTTQQPQYHFLDSIDEVGAVSIPADEENSNMPPAYYRDSRHSLLSHIDSYPGDTTNKNITLTNGPNKNFSDSSLGGPYDNSSSLFGGNIENFAILPDSRFNSVPTQARQCREQLHTNSPVHMVPPGSRFDSPPPPLTFFSPHGSVST